MNMEIEALLNKIEQRREEMIQLGLTSSFLDERVIQLSDQLDKLLNIYQYKVSAKEQ